MARSDLDEGAARDVAEGIDDGEARVVIDEEVLSEFRSALLRHRLGVIVPFAYRVASIALKLIGGGKP